MRDRTKEVERLKRQLQQLQGALGQNGSTTPPPEQDSPNGGNPGAVTPPPPTAHRMGEYVHHHQHWPHTSGPEHVNGLGLTTDGETPLTFDTSSFFPQLHQSPSGEMMTGIATPPPSTSGRRSRAVTGSSIASHGMPGNQHHLRSSSTGPLMMAPAASTCSSPIPHSHHHSQWHQPTGVDRRDSLQVGPMSTSPSPLLPVSRESFSMCSSPEEVSFLHHSHHAKPPPAYATSMDEGMATPTGPVYPPPPDSSELHSRGWSTSVDGGSGAAGGSPLMPPHSSSSSSVAYLSTVNELPEVAKPLPETTAPLLHFAVASGHIDTLRLLLARHDINLNGRDNAGYTPLQRAVADGRTDMAALLLERGAIVDGVEWIQEGATAATTNAEHAAAIKAENRL